MLQAVIAESKADRKALLSTEAQPLAPPSPLGESDLPIGKATKAAPAPEGRAPKPEALLPDTSPAPKAWKVVEIPVPSLPPVALKTPWHVTAPVEGPGPGAKGPVEAAGGSVPTSPKEEPLPARPEAAPTPADPTPKASHPIQPPVSQGPDGSALAALGTLPRAAHAPLAPVPPPPPVAAAPPTPALVQVEGGMRWMLKGGAQEAQLQLHPESLGQVTIHLKVEGGEVHARLWITEATSVKAIQEGRPHLESALKEQGLQLGSFDLQQGQRPFREAPTPAPFREPVAPEVPAARQEAPAAPPPSILNPHRVELYA